MKKSVLITLIIIFLGFCITSAVLFFRNNTFYNLTIPEEEEIKDIALNDRIITNQDEIQKIYNVLTDNSKGRTARTESLSDKPTEAEGLIQIYIKTKNGHVTTIYAYKQQYKYLLEQPNNALFVIKEDEYNELKDMLNG